MFTTAESRKTPFNKGASLLDELLLTSDDDDKNDEESLLDMDAELMSSELTEDELGKAEDTGKLLEVCVELRATELTETELDAIALVETELGATELITVTELDWVGCVDFPPEPPQPIINTLMATAVAIIFFMVDP